MQIDAEQASEKINDMGKSTAGIENFDNKVKVKDSLNQLSQTEGLQKVSAQTKGVVSDLKRTTHTNKFKNALLGIGIAAKMVGDFFANAFQKNKGCH